MADQMNTVSVLLSANETYTYFQENVTWDLPNLSATIDPEVQERCDLFHTVVNTGFIGTLCVLGILGNTVSILVLQKDTNNQVAVFLLQSLAFADNSILGITFVMLVLLAGLQPDIYDHARRSVPYLIKYVTPVAFMVHSTAIWITTLLAINRYIAVCKPFTAPNLLTLKRAKIHVALVVTLSILFNIPRFFQFDIVVGEDGYLTTKSTRIGQHSLFGIIYSNALYTIIVLIFPLLILMCLNFKIILAIRSSRINMRKNSLQSDKQSPKGDNITLIMVIIVLVLLVCHTPDRIFLIANAYYVNVIAENPDIGAKCPHPLWYALRVCNLLITLNSSTNFIIYYLFRRNFRMILKQKLTCIWKRERKASQTADNEPTSSFLLHAHCATRT